MAQDFQASKDYAKSLGSQTLNAMNQFHPETTFKDYNSAPNQAGYYQGIEAEKIDLTNPAAKALANDPGGKTVVEHFGENQFEVNTNSNLIKNAKLIEDESYAITHGISNDKINCEQLSQDCEMKTHDEICHTSRQLPQQSCIRKRMVTVGSDHISQRADFEVWVARKWIGNIAIDLITGAMSNGQGGHLTNPLRLVHPCKDMTASIHSVLNGAQKANWVIISKLPSCQNNATLTLNILDSFKRYYPLQVALTIDVQSKAYVSEEHWEDSCKPLEATGLCHKTTEQCTDKTATRLINGLAVTRDCWQYESTYHCASAPADECRIPRKKGCLQTGSHCIQKDTTGCMLYEQVYSCVEKVCPPIVGCVKNLFCADGDCTEMRATQNEDFATSIIPMAVVGGAGAEFSKTQTTLFSGHPVQCKIWIWNLIDCCSNEGWADKINLDLCRQEDKDLGKAKLNYLAHYVGEFCSKEVVGVCTEYKRTYCVFDSKMARIIQEEGRLNQLNPNALGNAQFANCAGLSVDELQQLDMGKIDFVKPVYPYPAGKSTIDAGIMGDVKLKGPDTQKTLDEIRRRIEQKAAK